VQVDPVKPKLKPPRDKRLKLKCDILLSNFPFKFNLRRYNLGLANMEFLKLATAVIGSFRSLRVSEGHKSEKQPASVAAGAIWLCVQIKQQHEVGPAGICFFFCPNSPCLVPQLQPIMHGLCPIMPNYAD